MQMFKQTHHTVTAPHCRCSQHRMRQPIELTQESVASRSLASNVAAVTRLALAGQPVGAPPIRISTDRLHAVLERTTLSRLRGS